MFSVSGQPHTRIANSTDNMDISAYADHEWVHSSWYFPANNTVYALTHNEYHCDRVGCPAWPNTNNLNFMSAVTLMQVRAGMFGRGGGRGAGQMACY